MKKICIVLFVVVLLTGCVKTIYLMPQYANMKIEGKTLIIANMDLFIDNPKDVTDDLGEGNPKEVYRKFFKYNFKGRIAQLSTFSKVEFRTIINEDEFSNRIFDIGKEESIYIKIPEDGQIVKTDSIYGDFVLFIQDYQVSRNVTHSSPVFMASPSGGSWVGGGSSTDLHHSFNFALWDNNEKQLVSYGKINSATGFLFAMTYETWNQSLSNIAKIILKGTPFENFPVEQNSRQY